MLENTPQTNSLYAKIEELLKSIPELVTEEKELRYNKIKEMAENGDAILLIPLMQNAEIKNAFFTPILDSFVFKTKEFKEFLDYSSSNNSYSQYLGKKIGLYCGDSALTDRNEVVLNFPFKDCVLEGGQKKEDGLDTYFEYDEKTCEYVKKQLKRREVFFNETLAKDEIDNLFSPKAFCNVKKYTTDGESSCVNFTRDAEVNKKRGLSEDTITDNLIIKGNNLLALHSLKKEFEGKIKLIYIDPPYNTKNPTADTFIYNNTFKNSSWLTFMQNRLTVARELLTEEGALIIAIDENEHSYLGVLLHNLFDDKYEIHNITIVHNPRGVQGTNFSYTNEFAYFIIPKGKKIIVDRKIADDEIDWRNLRDNGGESLRTDAKNCFYPIIVQDNKIIGFGDVILDESIHPKQEEIVNNFHYIYPIDINGIERKWRYARQTIENIKDLLRVKKVKNRLEIELGKNFGTYRTVWNDARYDANEYGKKVINDLVPNCPFSFPKSLWNVYDCLYSIVGKDKTSIILDFFGGSGTTAHAVEELNKSDNGNRQFIICEQMDYINTVTVPRVAEVIKRNNHGSFVYMELAEKNEKAMNLISACKNYDELVLIFNTLATKYFLHYNVRINDFINKTCKEEQFKNLSLEKQKEIFCRMLDLNQLYVNCDDRNDKDSGLSEKDIKATENFYQIQKDGE